MASFLPHRRGYGNSPGPGWLDEVTADFATPEYDAQLAPRLDRESDDVLTALARLHTVPEVDAGPARSDAGACRRRALPHLLHLGG